MRKGLAAVVFVMWGCSPSGPSGEDTPAVSPTQPEPTVETPEPEPEPEPEPVPQAAGVEVLMTAATLADDCGGVPNTTPKPKPKPTQSFAAKSEPKRRGKSDRAMKSKAKRRCKQSSIQLAVTAAEGAKAATIAVKSVELLLASGDSLGMLTTRSPSVWTDGEGYAPWNETVEPGQDLSVSYAVSQPDWGRVDDRRSQRYTVKAVVSIAGADTTLEQNVVVDTPTSLPPNVKT